ASIAAALDEVGAPWNGVMIERVANRPMQAAPAEVLQALEQADAGILCVQPQQGELAARMAIVSVVERRRIRYAHMVGVTPQIMRQGMRAAYRLDGAPYPRLGGSLPHALLLSVKTPPGSSFYTPL